MADSEGDLHNNPYPAGFVRPSLPTGRSGDWSIETFDVDPDEDKAFFYNAIALRDGCPHRVMPKGTYTRLMRGRSALVMSDTPGECWEHQEALLAKGKVLIAGLGIGMVLGTLASKQDVTEIVVCEKEQDVINLVWPSYEKLAKVTLHHGDIFDFDIDPSFDFCWFDIWDDICLDNIAEMSELMRRSNAAESDSASWSLRHLIKENSRLLEFDDFDFDFDHLLSLEQRMEKELGKIYRYRYSCFSD